MGKKPIFFTSHFLADSFLNYYIGAKDNPLDTENRPTPKGPVGPLLSLREVFQIGKEVWLPAKTKPLKKQPIKL